jgi:hypothetical protein
MTLTRSPQRTTTSHPHAVNGESVLRAGMKVFVGGGTGAIGRHAVPAPVAGDGVVVEVHGHAETTVTCCADQA